MTTKRYKKVPPEGGWGFLVLLGLAIFLVCMIPKHAGLVTNYFFKKFSVRAVALCGAMIFLSGSVWAIFARSMTELIFAFGILEGAGFGLMISASYSTFNAYFVKRRIMMMSFAQTLFGLGSMAYPLFVQYFMEEFGYRGFMAIRAGVHGNVIFGMLVMHPVEWHYEENTRRR
ncbi:hypothetical protein HA402_002453 [Bradysia odoriphaga]|nr:hypothetical protein HA402_002453 [Bradysia odoriphaga]